jgi:hypothetical protein
MKNESIQLTPADREFAKSVIAGIYQTQGYQLARQYVRRAALRPLRCFKTCAIDYVCQAMAAATGYSVSEGQMAMALADEGFTARDIDGVASTNVGLRGLRRSIREGVELPLSTTEIQPGPARRFHC